LYAGGSADKRTGLLGLLHRNIAANCTLDAAVNRQTPSVHEVWWGNTQQLITGKHVVLHTIEFIFLHLERE
jgi:hypothetical protein